MMPRAARRLLRSNVMTAFRSIRDKLTFTAAKSIKSIQQFSVAWISTSRLMGPAHYGG